MEGGARELMKMKDVYGCKELLFYKVSFYAFKSENLRFRKSNQLLFYAFCGVSSRN
jgi:hypothetical protein